VRRDLTLIPDDVIPELPITPKLDALWVLASATRWPSAGSTHCDLGMSLPDAGPEVRECYVKA